MMRWRDEFSPDFITNYFIITYMIQRGILDYSVRNSTLY